MLTPQTPTRRTDNIKPLLVGKTVKRINNKGHNCLDIEFTDGTEFRIEAENVCHLGFYVRDERSVVSN